MDDDELEQVVRTDLAKQAARAQVDTLVVSRARGQARRRRTTRVSVLGAAAAVVAVAGVLVAVVDRDETRPPSATDSAATDPTQSPPAPADSAATDPTQSPPAPLTGPVRTEYWRGVQVDVPADWGYGNPVACGDAPVGESYVGRPITTTDVCGVFDPDTTPTAPYLWFDVPDVAVGTVDLGGGWERTTIEQAGVRVSVAAHDPGLAASILGTATAGDLCSPTMASVPDPRYDNTVEGNGPFVRARLCAYEATEAGTYELHYAASIGRSDFETTFDEVDQAPVAESCGRTSSEVVVLTGGYADPYGPAHEVALERDVVYRLSCGVVSVAHPFDRAPSSRRVTAATVPWAGPEFERLLTGPPEAWAYDRFIGVQG
ncbi:hypothetical protein [Nocardioides plantarum]|uniref:Uncharacterized protein n=1 Tax=Nocardioides plantarum TaxID=29299 RepID=A0ABV5K4T1_9ACTN|nr:hypothetical protein [Nocardioides plantarum]